MTNATGSQSESVGRAPAIRARPPDRTAQSDKVSMSLPRMVLSILLGISALALLASCAPGQSRVKAPTAPAQASATIIPSATVTTRLVYQADWSHGLAGWTATPGWFVSGGALQSDTGSDREITSPFYPTTPDYAVEFRLRLISVSPTAATEYALNADSSSGADGYIALFDHVMLHQCMFACHPHEAIYIDPMVDQDVGTGTIQIHDFEPGTRWLTYRVEVRGPQATLLINGHIASSARGDKTLRLSAGALHFYCTGVELRMSDFKVYAL